ncbi:MAG: oligosaccharide flippase family protein [Methylobacillus sp.]|nr:oligosaccharide flippase family protein [Methylobacillus sp.]
MAQGLFSVWLARWRYSALLRRMGTLTSGTALAQLIQLINFVILAKLYTLAEIGMYSMFVAIVSILAPVALLGYERLIPNASDEDLGPYLKALLLLLLPMTLLLSLLATLLLYGHTLAVGIWIAGAMIQRLAEMHNIRENRFRWISVARLSPPLTMTLLLAAFAWLDVQGMDRLIIWQAGLMLALGLTYAALTLPRAILSTHHSIARMQETLRTSINAPLYLMPSSLLNLAAYNVPVLVIGHWLGSELAAQYAYVLRFGFGPVALVGGTLYQVFYGFLSEAVRTGNKAMFEQYARARRHMKYISMATMIGMALGYPLVFRYVLGPEWMAAGWISMIFAPLFAIMLYTNSVSVVLNVFNRQHYELISQINYFVISVLAFGLAALTGNAWLGFALFSLFGCLRYVLLLRDINKVLVEHKVIES